MLGPNEGYEARRRNLRRAVEVVVSMEAWRLRRAACYSKQNACRVSASHIHRRAFTSAPRRAWDGQTVALYTIEQKQYSTLYSR